MNDGKIPQAIRLGRALSKPVAGLVLFALSLQSHALDFTPDASRVLSDLAYLPQQDQFVSATSYSSTRTHDEVYNYLGTLKTSDASTSKLLSQTFSDGITDDLTLRITAAYGHTNTSSNPAAGVATSTVSYGLDDPVLDMIWRVLDQKDHALNWDLIASYAPDLVQAIAASPTQVGSVARGGQATTLETAISYKTRDFTIYADGGATYVSRRDLSDNISTITTYTSYWQYFLSLNTQTRLNEAFAITAGVTGTFTDKYFGAIPGTVTAFDVRAGNVTNFNAALVYNITPNKLVTTLTYNHIIYANAGIDYATLPSSSTTIKSKSANAIGVRLQYLFD